MEVDPERHVTVCCGSTETMLSTLLAVLNPGDEVIVFEPFCFPKTDDVLIGAGERLLKLRQLVG
jgi:aminotransferase